MKSKITIPLIALILLLSTMLIIIGQTFSVTTSTAKPSTVYVPSYSSLSCSQTRLEYFPAGDGLNIQWQDVPASGLSYWCNGKTLSDSYFAKGCDVYLTSTGLFDRTIKVCNDDGTNCQDLSSAQATNTWTTGSKSLHLDYNKKIYITPKGALFSTDYKIRIVAPVYGIVIEGQGVKPTYSSKCNLQSLLSDKAIAVLKNNPDYATILATNQISEGIFPQVFVTGYRESYKDTRVIAKEGIYWFVEDIGYICKIEQGSDGLFYVSDDCKSDSSIQCYPNIGNCDANAKITTSPTNSCVAGTLIGSTGGRKVIIGDQACYLRCSETGTAEKTDCVTIQKCASGYTWNDNYECIKAEDATQKSICEANNNRWVELKQKDGTVLTYCEKSSSINIVTLYIILGFLVAMIVILGIYIWRNRK